MPIDNNIKVYFGKIQVEVKEMYFQRQNVSLHFGNFRSVATQVLDGFKCMISLNIFGTSVQKTKKLVFILYLGILNRIIINFCIS